MRSALACASLLSAPMKERNGTERSRCVLPNKTHSSRLQKQRAGKYIRDETDMSWSETDAKRGRTSRARKLGGKHTHTHAHTDTTVTVTSRRPEARGAW